MGLAIGGEGEDEGNEGEGGWCGKLRQERGVRARGGMEAETCAKLTRVGFWAAVLQALR